MKVANELPSLAILSANFYLDASSPSGLRWKVERRKGKGVGYVCGLAGDVAGGIDNKYW